MKKFMDENFLLQTETAQKLYHEHAAKMPIIDYHCHLIPKMVADDYQFKSLTEIWLGGDHYKWRAMRTNGVDERFCTGKDTSDWEKFEKWAETVPYTFRNPLYHWTHLELKTAFGIDKILSPKTAREIYDECNEKLAQPEYSARGMMRRYHVEAVCTTDDPIDSLEYHIQTRESGFEIKMLPTWRPDKAIAVEVPADFRAYVEKLAEVSGVAISNFDDMVTALRKRHDFFAEQGCKLSDHGIEEFYAEDYTDAEIKAIFNKVYGGAELTKEEILKFKSAMLVIFGEMDWEKGWTQQVLGKKLGKKTSTISAYETNAKLPSVDCLIEMAELFDVSLDTLVYGDRSNLISIRALRPEQKELISELTQVFSARHTTAEQRLGLLSKIVSHLSQ